MKEFTGANDENISSNGFSENGNIQVYNFIIETDNGKKSISISQKGGHVVYMNYYRETEEQKISDDEAIEIGKNFLTEKGYDNMKETYYLKQSGCIVVNYAYTTQDNITVYADLIKLKIALDNGEILGMESAGYLNCHYEREKKENIITVEKAREKINPRIEVNNQKLAIIPTEYNTEILCWEFQGKVGENEFLVYINAENGKEEDILMIVNTPNGTLTA